MVLTSAGRWSRGRWPACRRWRGWSRGMPVVATRVASRNTTVYSNRARARGPGPAVRRMVNRMTTAAARAIVSRPRSDRPGAGSSWPRTKPATTRKPPTARVGHSQRPTERAVWRGRGPWSTSGAHPGAQPEETGPSGCECSRAAPSRGGLAVGGASVHGVRGRAAAPGPGWATWSGRPAAAAEGDDGFAAVAGGGAVGAGLGAAVQGDATRHAGHGPGAVT